MTAMFNAFSTSDSSSNVIGIRLRDFYQAAAEIFIPVDDQKVYLPERSWTKTFAEGLAKLQLAESCVLEVGVGSGINMAGLILCDKPPRLFIGTDIAKAAVDASGSLARQHCMNAISLESDLLSELPQDMLNRVDHIIGCIPQVPLHKGEMSTERDKSDYYEETGIREDSYGLGLLARLLDQTKTRAPHASVTLNVAGRPGEKRINDLFNARQYTHEIIHRRVVQQDANTSLASLAEIEKNSGVAFHFYKSPEGGKEINACEAEELRLARVPIYHDLSVIKARL